MLRKTALFLFLILIIVGSTSTVRAGSNKEYLTVVELNGITIDQDPSFWIANDQNFFGDADVLFKYIIDPQNPDLNEISDTTTDPIEIGSGETVTLDTPIEIARYTSCQCDQAIDSFLHVLDYAPVKSTIKSLFKKGAQLTGSYITTGPIGAGVSLLGEVVSWIGEKVLFSSLSVQEQQAYIQAEIYNNSDTIGVAHEVANASCLSSPYSTTPAIEFEEREIGDVQYSITISETGNQCPTDQSAPASPQDAGNSDGITDYDCDETTGKVRVNGEYVCPTSSFSQGTSCQCIQDYEWAYADNKCEGCTKTDPQKCMEAVRQTIDEAIALPEPDLSFVGERTIRWDMGPASCKHHEELVFDFADYIKEALPKYKAQCTNLEYTYAESAPECSAYFYFQYKPGLQEMFHE